MTMLKPNPFQEQISQLINYLSEQFEKEKALLQKSVDGVSEILCFFLATFDGFMYQYRVEESLEETSKDALNQNEEN